MSHCEYSYYIENYYRCTITGEICNMSAPDEEYCTIAERSNNSGNTNDR